MTNVFSKKEIEILELYLKNKKNKEIAKDLDVSEPYISQTLSKIRIKLESIEDSLELLEGLGIVNTVSTIQLTETGRKSFPNKLTSLESSKKSQLSKLEDKKIDYEIALPPAPSFANVVDVTPVFGSPHDHLKYTITELVKGIFNQSFESTRKLSVRLGIAEDIIHDVKTTINANLTNINDSQHFNQFNILDSRANMVQPSDAALVAYENAIGFRDNPTMVWGDSIRFKELQGIRMMGLEHLLIGIPMMSLQSNSSSEQGQRKIITASNVTGDSYGR